MFDHSTFAFPTTYSVFPENSSVDYKGVLRNDCQKSGEGVMLYNEHVCSLFDYGMQMSGNRQLVIDCLKDLHVNLWNKEGVFDNRSGKPYLFRSFRKLLVHQIFENQHPISLPADYEVFKLVPAFVANPNDNESNLGWTARLNSGIQCLSKDQREVIYLKFNQGFSNGEIAIVTELQIDTVLCLVSKTLELLCRKMEALKHPVTVL